MFNSNMQQIQASRYVWNGWKEYFVYFIIDVCIILSNLVFV